MRYLAAVLMVVGCGVRSVSDGCNEWSVVVCDKEIQCAITTLASDACRASAVKSCCTTNDCGLRQTQESEDKFGSCNSAIQFNTCDQLKTHIANGAPLKACWY